MDPTNPNHREQWIEASAVEAARQCACDLFELSIRRIGSRWALVVTLDRPDGVTVEDCARVSRTLSAMLDATDAIPEAYALEVSSPGLTRPLTTPADYQRFRGRLAVLHARRPIAGKTEIRGILAGLGAEGTTVKLRPAGGVDEVEVPLAEVARARLDVELPGATARPRREGRRR
jgi:ribosome maturation factor RimP